MPGSREAQATGEGSQLERVSYEHTRHDGRLIHGEMMNQLVAEFSQQCRARNNKPIHE